MIFRVSYWFLVVAFFLTTFSLHAMSVELGHVDPDAPTSSDGKSAPLTVPTLPAAAPRYVQRDAFDAIFERLGNRLGGNMQVSRKMEQLYMLKELPNITALVDVAITEAQDELAKMPNPRDPEKVARLNNRIQSYRHGLAMLEAELGNQSPIGSAIARGLAGGAWEAIKDQPVSGISDGMMLGGALLVSTKCSDSLGRRIAGAVDRVVGGTWDWCINGLVNSWHALVGLVFPHSAKPFDFKTLGIWQEFVKTMFDNIDKLLKDGLKDSLRGKDSTLRKVDEPVVDEAQTMNVWRMLIDGYARQIDFFVATIDQNLVAAQGAWVVDANVVFFAQELRRRLLEFQAIITKAKNPKEFDALIDSNKSLITGYRCNIESLLQRLIASIEQPISTTDASGSPTKINRMSRGSMGDDDDSKLPGSFLGR